MDLSTFPSAIAAELRSFPAALLDLLEAELAAGNTIEQAGAGFPAPPIGAKVVLGKRISTRELRSEGELLFREWPNAVEPRGFSDLQKHFFVLDPRDPEPVLPTMDEIRAAHEPPPMAIDGRTREPGDPFVGQFLASMVIDYEKWHDGIGYAVDSLAAASPAQRTAIESMLLARGISDWRDVETLAALDTPRAREALVKLHALGSTELRLAVERHAPDLVGGDERTRSMLQALSSAELGSGLSQALDAAADFHPPAVVDALFAAALHRDGQTACLAAGMLWHVHGRSDDTFDWDQRPLFLRFNTDDHAERIAAFRELCGLLGVDPQPYLARA